MPPKQQPPSPKQPAQPPKPQRPKTPLDKYYQDWEKKVAAMTRQASTVDWSKVDLSKLNPSDIGVHLGPPMTEEQFRAYRARQGKPVRVLKPGEGLGGARAQDTTHENP